MSKEEKEKIAVPMEPRSVEEAKPFLPMAEGAPEPPPDKYSLVYLIIFLHGIGTLMPWNMFITIADTYYVHFKMLEKPDNSSIPSIKTSYSENYMSAQNICSQLPNLLLNLINIFIVVKGDLTKRIGVSLTVVGACILLTMSFIFADTWTWMGGFFALTLAIVILLNGSNGIYQNSIFGLVSDFPFKYTNAVIIGNNFCGTFVSLISIVSIYAFSDVPTQALVYFAISLLTIAACFCSFFVLKKLPFYRHYAIDVKRMSTEVGEPVEKNEEEEKGVTFAEFIDTFKEGWIGFTNVFLIFFVTLTIFPATMIDVVPLPGDWFKEKLGNLHIPVMVFLQFNLLAFIGSMLASWKQLIPHTQLRWYAYARVLLIPAFLFLNYRPGKRGTLPVIFPSFFFVVFGAIMSLSSGYMSSLAMMYAPRYVSESRGRIAMMMAAFFLISGIVGGILASKFIQDIFGLL